MSLILLAILKTYFSVILSPPKWKHCLERFREGDLDIETQILLTLMASVTNAIDLSSTHAIQTNFVVALWRCLSFVTIPMALRWRGCFLRVTY
jgi:membrane protein YdbS with pleckstrin-like domain